MALVAYAGLNHTYATVAGSPTYANSASEGTYATTDLSSATANAAVAAQTVNGRTATEVRISFRINVTSNTLAAGAYRTVAFTDNATLGSTTYGSTNFKIRFYQNGNVTVLFNGAESPVLSTWTLNTYQMWGLKITTIDYILYRDGVIQGSVSANTGINSTILTRYAVGQLGDGSGTGSLTLRTNTIAAVNNVGGSRTMWYDYNNDLPVVISPVWTSLTASNTAPSTTALRRTLAGPPIITSGISAYAASQTPDYNGFTYTNAYALYNVEGFETVVLAARNPNLSGRITTCGIAFDYQGSTYISFNQGTNQTSKTIPYLSETSPDRNAGAILHATYGLSAAQTYPPIMGGVGFYRERPLVQAKLWLVDDNAASTDRYLVAFFQDGTALTEGAVLSGVRLKVTKASDGTTLFGPSDMTAISNGLYKLDVTGNSRITDGAGYIATLTANVGGRDFTWYQPVSRDS